uniref:Protein S100 n=1 Tax=Myripristis murdjan TaxID=586833 RepID=A0A667X8B8_9TELE
LWAQKSAIETITTTFLEYAAPSGDPTTLSLDELKKLVQEVDFVILQSKDPKEMKKIFEELDEDSNKEVNFLEYTSIIMRLFFVYMFKNMIELQQQRRQ